MPQEWCKVGTLTSLPSALQQRYDQLEAPQCTNLTYVYQYLQDKMLLFINDAEIRDNLCHLSEAASYLNRIHVSTII